MIIKFHTINLMKNVYDEQRQEHFKDVEKDYKPAYLKKCLKPPKPTKANELRTKAQIEKGDHKNEYKALGKIISTAQRTRP